MNVAVENNAKNQVHVEVSKTKKGVTVVISSIDQTPLHDIAVGSTFEKDGNKFIVLEHFEDGTTAVIAKESVKTMEFGKNNNWVESDIRKHLNGEYFEKLQELFGDDNIAPHQVDLLSLDGLDDYGTTSDKVSLLTIDQYRKYRKAIGENLSNWWWLATPDSTPSGYSTNFVRCVSPGGGMRCYSYAAATACARFAS